MFIKVSKTGESPGRNFKTYMYNRVIVYNSLTGVSWYRRTILPVNLFVVTIFHHSRCHTVDVRRYPRVNSRWQDQILRFLPKDLSKSNKDDFSSN